MDSVKSYIQSHRQAFEDDLADLLRIASVSADSRQRAETRRAADWVVKQFEQIGLATELIPTAGHPLVYAESPPVPGKPVALVYGHYDVQPPEPLDEWISPPFEPTVRDGNIYARGATDDKGQMLTHVKSVEAWLKAVGKLPLQVKFLIEGEEEVGSEHLDPFVKANREKLACDTVVISDCSQFAPGMPAITYGLRGIAYFELRASRPQAGFALRHVRRRRHEPGQRTGRAAGRTQGQGRPHPGARLLRRRVPLTDRERAEFRSLPLTDDEFMKSVGVKGLFGEAGFTSIERRWARPTCDINGLTSGYQGEGAKTVLPARASAKFSFRLVPNRIRRRSPRRFASSSKNACRRASRWSWSIITGHRASSCRSKPLCASRGRGDRKRLRPGARVSSAKAARFRSSTRSPRARRRRAAAWAGARTTTTPTAPTKSSASTTTTAAHSPVRSFGKNSRS